ncbi:MAG: glucosamine-6-phosphate deaminase [Cyanobacteriota bacterium]
MRRSFATTTGEPSCAPTELGKQPGGGFQLLDLPSSEAVARHAAELLLAACLEQPRRPLGLATGRTMTPIYAALVALVQECPAKEQETLRSHWCSFNLDEYVGLGPEQAGSFATEMRLSIGQPLAIAPHQVHLPNGLAEDPEAEAIRYRDALCKAGGVGLQLLGLGLNGHVGFNEPPCAANTTARCVQLSASTRRANASAFGGDPDGVPTRAITLGLAEILEADRILLVVTGAAKAAVLRRLLDQPPSADLPASWLHQHPSVCLLADPAALSG